MNYFHKLLQNMTILKRPHKTKTRASRVDQWFYTLILIIRMILVRFTGVTVDE